MQGNTSFLCTITTTVLEVYENPNIHHPSPSEGSNPKETKIAFLKDSKNHCQAQG